MSVQVAQKEQFVVYLHNAKSYHYKGNMYRRGDADTGHFVGSKEDCEHLLNQRQYGVDGKYIWEETPYQEKREEVRTLTKAASSQPERAPERKVSQAAAGNPRAGGRNTPAPAATGGAHIEEV